MNRTSSIIKCHDDKEIHYTRTKPSSIDLHGSILINGAIHRTLPNRVHSTQGSRLLQHPHCRLRPTYPFDTSLPRRLHKHRDCSKFPE